MQDKPASITLTIAASILIGFHILAGLLAAFEFFVDSITPTRTGGIDLPQLHATDPLLILLALGVLWVVGAGAFALEQSIRSESPRILSIATAIAMVLTAADCITLGYIYATA